MASSTRSAHYFRAFTQKTKKPLTPFLLILLSIGFTACSETKELRIGTGSRIDILTSKDQFYKGHIPDGWIINGVSSDDLFDPHSGVPNVYMKRIQGRTGLDVKNAQQDFIIARYTGAQLLVSPFLTWQWYVSDFRTERHPVRFLIGFHGGKSESESLEEEDLIWRGEEEELPSFDRVLAIGFDHSALSRGHITSMGKVQYYTQRGGPAQMNQWIFEAVDLARAYEFSWPQDQLDKVRITFVGLMAQGGSAQSGITFSSIKLSR